MSAILIPCPKCGSGLKLKDRSKLGKLGKCPKCTHRFVLQEPDEVELELAEAAPAVGQAAQWVPDSGPAFPNLGEGMASAPVLTETPVVTDSQQATGLAVPSIPQVAVGMPQDEVIQLLGKPAKKKQMAPPPQAVGQASKTAAKYEYLLFKHRAGLYKLLLADGVVSAVHSQPDPSDTAIQAAKTGSATTGTTATARSVIQTPSRRARMQRNIGIGVGAVLALVAMGVIISVSQREPEVITVKKQKAAPKKNEVFEAAKQVSKDNFAAIKEEAKELFKTRGERIPLNMLPTGANYVVHLRPQQLWGDEPRFQELRAAAGTLTMWAETQLTELLRFPLSEIEEVTVCIYTPGQSVPPMFAAYVKLAAEHKKSEFLEKFVANRSDEYGTRSGVSGVYVRDDTAYVILNDLQTYSVGPLKWVDEMLTSVPQRGYMGSMQTATPGVEEILAHTDRDRLMTVVFRPAELRTYRRELFDERLHPFVDHLVDWFDVDTEAVAWSMHVNDQKFLSQFLLRNAHAWSARQLESDISRRLDTLPKELYQMVEYMKPQKSGPQQLIGRFPAMMKVFSLGTYSAFGDRVAQFTTVLSERAAPNLAAAALLTWDESTRTNFDVAAPPSAGPKLPATVAGRLKLPMEVDFRRRPLQEAFADIGEATKVTFEIDGDALKLAGYTKNMAQTFDLGEVPASAAVKKILSQYEQMCVCLTDEKSKTVTVMTRPVAKAKGLTPMKFE